LRRGDGEIICVEDAYLNEVLLPGFLQHGTPTSLYDALGDRGLRPTQAEDSIAAERASAEDARVLEIAEGDPILRHSRRAMARDLIIEVSRTLYRHGSYTIYHQIGS
jgi:GntR family transcriptional regulator